MSQYPLQEEVNRLVQENRDKEERIKRLEDRVDNLCRQLEHVLGGPV